MPTRCSATSPKGPKRRWTGTRSSASWRSRPRCSPGRSGCSSTPTSRPSLTFSYSYLTQSDIFNLSQWKWFPSSTIGLSLSIPIFSGGQRYHAIKQTRVQADELELQRENAERQLRIGIRQSLGTMDTAMRTYDASKEALVSAEKAYDIAVKSYQLGKSTLTDLNNVELTLTQSRLAVSQAIYNFVIAKAGLEQTLGYDFNAN